MATAPSDKVASFFAGLGFDSVAPTDRCDLVIDSYDQWTNPRHSPLSPTICTCVMEPEPERVI
jgi:hypothetical protein